MTNEIMTFEKYRGLTGKTNTDLGEPMNTIHMILGLQTEVAELADIIKKHIAYSKPIDWTNFKEELGDTFWYLSEMMNIHGLDTHEILQKNINKLEERYNKKDFSSEKALNRDLVKERAILEK